MRTRNVCFGSEADARTAKRRVRFTSESGHSANLRSLLALAGNSELGFDESGEGKNLRPRPLHSDLFQNRLKLLAKSIKGCSRMPNIDHAAAARHRSCNVREYPLDRPVGEPLSAPSQYHLDALFVFSPGRRTAKFKKDSNRHGVSPDLS